MADKTATLLDAAAANEHHQPSPLCHRISENGRNGGGWQTIRKMYFCDDDDDDNIHGRRRRRLRFFNCRTNNEGNRTNKRHYCFVGKEMKTLSSQLILFFLMGTPSVKTAFSHPQVQTASHQDRRCGVIYIFIVAKEHKRNDDDDNDDDNDVRHTNSTTFTINIIIITIWRVGMQPVSERCVTMQTDTEMLLVSITSRSSRRQNAFIFMRFAADFRSD